MVELMEADHQATAAIPPAASPPLEVAFASSSAVQGSGAGSSTDGPTVVVEAGTVLNAEAPPRAGVAESAPAAVEPGDAGQDEGAFERVPEICGPSSLGYITEDGRSIGRITAAFSGSRGVRCYLHAKCSIAIKENRMPTNGDIIAWLLAAERIQPTDSAEEKAAKRDRHMQALRVLRDNKP